ncbi:MAG: RecQ family ATP-dependent DNA helicase [Spirochaetales bacterium]|jgi:ATP-dependent DNA helicase RecQ|nr:RecQ family ATP-dependent DNA helicase [Spirochaetales bacterium]
MESPRKPGPAPDGREIFRNFPPEQGESDPLEEEARKRFGIGGLAPYQRLVIQNILEAFQTAGDPDAPEDLAPELSRNRQIVILPTGAGKSLCFMLPAVFLPGLTLVIFPLLALMSDQLRRLAQGGIPSGALRGGQTREEREGIFREAEAGRLKLILSNPETVIQPGIRDRLAKLPLDHAVLDEAHTLYEWGQTFRPAYRDLAETLKGLPVRVLTAFTATASPDVLAGIREMAFPRGAHLIQGSPDRENISYRVLPSLHPAWDTARLLLPRAGKEPGLPLARPALVFCSSRRLAEQTARDLRFRSGDREIFFYHAGLSRPEKSRIEEWFFHSKGGILCATCAYGMGVDKPDIRTVIHREPPATVEAYLQEAGRAGRDRRPSEAVLLRPWFPPSGPERAPFAGAEGGTGTDEEGGTPEGGFARQLARRRLAFLQVLYNDTLCRRQGLLALLNAAPEACAGCDVCRGEVVRAPQGVEELLPRLKRLKRRYTGGQLKFLLAGYGSSRILRDRLFRSRDFGRLSPLSPDDVQFLLKKLAPEAAKKGLFRKTP